MLRLFLTILLLFKISFALNIVSTIKPFADISKEVVKDKANVSYIIPPNVSVHIYEYKVSDVRKVANADLFLYVGSGESNIDNLVKVAKRKALVPVSYIDGIFLIKNFEFEEDEHHEDEEHGFFHPALWLDPYNAKVIAKEVYIRVSELDPENKEFYKKNYENFAKRCDELIKYGNEKLSSLKQKDFISYHYAWPYFTKRFGLNYLAVIELGHGREPSIKYILKIVKLIKDKRIKSIFAAKQFYNPKYTNLIKRETGVSIVILDPFGIDIGYLEMVKFNIDKVYKGLK